MLAAEQAVAGVAARYHGFHRVTSRTDAKGQQTQYDHDASGRVTEVRHYVLVNGTLTEDQKQRVDYYYDSNPFTSKPSTFSQNTWGRLAAVQFGWDTPYTSGGSFYYMYSYNTAGRLTGGTMDNGGGPQPMASASYGPAGEMLSLLYNGYTETRT